MADRLFDALVVLLRHPLNSGHIAQHPLIGLGHPQLAKAIVAKHDKPAVARTLERLVERVPFAQPIYRGVRASGE